MSTAEQRAKAAAYMKKWGQEHPERLAATQQRHREKALLELADPNDPRHGREATYVLGCRCPVCREAHRVRAAEYRARVRGAV